MATDNTLLDDWTTPHGAPPFERIAPAQFGPAFDEALARHVREVEAVASDPAEPTFENTIAALERSGRTLNRVSSVFHVLAGAHTNDTLLAVDREVSPKLAAHRSRIFLNEALFARIDALHASCDTLSLNPEQRRVLERYHINFRRAGAG